MEGGRRERGGAGADEADFRDWVWKRGLEENLVDCWHSSVPCCAVRDEVVPKLFGRELWRDDDGSPGEEGGEEASEETVNMEEWHHKVGTICGRQLVGGLDVACGKLC